MSKNEFIGALCMKLRTMPAEEAQKTVLFYSEAIDDRIEDGLSEDEAVAAMGDIDDIVYELMGEEQTFQTKSEGTTGREKSFERKEYKYALDGVRCIDIQDSNFDVSVVESPDELIHVHCVESGDMHYDISSGETLSIKRVKDYAGSVNDLMDFKNIRDLRDLKNVLKSFYKNSVVTLSKEMSKLIIAVPDIENVDLFISTSSGDIDIRIPAVRSARFRASSGDIDVKNLSASGEIFAVSTSGDTDIEAVRCERLNISSTSGDIEIKVSSAVSSKIHTTSGDIEIEDLSVSDRFEANTVSGDVDCRLSSICNSVNFSSTSGDVDAVLAGSGAEYRVTVNTVSGRCNVRNPNYRIGGNCEFNARTVSGDIDVNFKG